MIESKIDINQRDSLGNSALINAVISSKTEIVHYLTNNNIDCHIVNNDNENAFHYCYMNNDIEICNILKYNSVNVNLQNKYKGNTPLHNTTLSDNKMIAEFLIENNANLELQNNDGDTPLLLAFKNKAYECVKLFIQRMCKVNVQNNKYKTPIMYAVKQNQLELIKLLLSKGADVNFQHSFKSPLLIAFKNHLISAMKILLGARADPNLQFFSDKSTIIHHFATAIDKYHDEILLMKKYNLDINRKNCYGQTALMIASKTCDVQLLKYYQNLQADFGLSDEKGKNIFHYSSLNQQNNLITFLDTLELDISIVDNLERTPMHYSKNTDQLQYMMRYHSNWYFKDKYGRTPFHTAAFDSFIEGIKIYIEHRNIDINSTDIFGRTPLHLAVQSGNTEMIKLLLESGSDVNIADNNNWTPLFFSNTIEHVELLIKYESDINLLDNSGRRPVLTFAQGGYADIVSFLIDKGCKLDCVDKLGQNLLHYAINMNNEALIKKVIDTKQIDIDHKDNKGISPLLLAKIKNNKNYIYLLLEKGCKLDYGSTTRRIIPIKIIKNILKKVENSQNN